MGAAFGWGGLPTYGADYITNSEPRPVGEFRLVAEDVPVDGFWSIGTHNRNRYLGKNELESFSVDNLAAMPKRDGAFSVNFGGREDGRVNCLYSMGRRSPTVRLYRPRPEIQAGSWAIPVPRFGSRPQRRDAAHRRPTDGSTCRPPARTSAQWAGAIYSRRARGGHPLKVNFCFDFVIAVANHDEAVERYQALFGIDPVEIDSATLPESGQRCTVFPMWDLGDRGMALSIVSSSDPNSPLATRVRERGEGLAYCGLDVDDVDAMIEQGRSAGFEFSTERPVEYDYGQMLSVQEETAHNIPFFFSNHHHGWWEKVKRGGR